LSSFVLKIALLAGLVELPLHGTNKCCCSGVSQPKDSDYLALLTSTNTDMMFIFRAGVAGLTTALLLSKNPEYNIVVAAKHMPGDYDIEYASPWAGANYMPLVILDQ
jgi:hypothetical protein